MTTEEAKRRAELYSALAEGKTIQAQNPIGGEWFDVKIETLRSVCEELKYRIKPEIKYRPFKSQEECWDEMLKHKPFGWVKNIETGDLCNISNIYESEGCSKVFLDTCAYTFSSLLNEFTFIDGTPFGIKEE